MAVAKMKLVKVTGPLDKLNNFISTCCLDGSFQPEQATQYMSASMGYLTLSEENPYAPMLQKIEELIRENDSAPDPTIVGDRSRDIELDDKTSAYIDELDKNLSALHDEYRELEDQLKQCRDGIAQYEHFTGFDVGLDELFNCKFIKTRFGHMPKESYEKLVAYEDNPYVLFIPCSTDATDYWGVYCVPRERVDEVDSVFAGLNFERLQIPSAVGTVEEVIDQLKSNIEIIEGDLKQLDERAAALWKENRKRCNEIYTKLVDLNTVFELRRYAACHNKYFFYVGWVPAHVSKEFEKKAEAIPHVEVEENDPDKSSKTPPVKLRNPLIFKPYEFFVDMYGLPSYSDIDVTGFVAITYTLLFGIMFGDLGQGLVLFLLGILGWRIKKMSLARILIPCGLSSAVFGFVFGSVFGYEDMLDPVYHALGMASKPLSVMDSINTVLIIAIGIGVVLVVTAMLLNVVSCLKHKKIGEAIFSNNGLVGIVFYLAGVAFCVAFMNGPKVLPNSVLFGIMGVCAVLLYLKEIPIGIIDKHPDWKPDSVVDFLLQNLFELIEYVLSYFSNTVSFLRVGAFVIVHASMMMVVFTLGGNGSNIPVIIIGNIIVIALEGLLSGIQGLRLEFYEMFSRFYEGGGKAFTPAKLEQAQSNIKTKIANKKARRALANKD